MINLCINIEFYTGPESLLNLWPSHVEKFLLVTYNQQEARHAFLEIGNLVKDIPGAKLFEGQMYIECPFGYVKICTVDSVENVTKGLHGVGVLISPAAYRHMTIDHLMRLHNSSASFFDRIDQDPHL